jgi:hypothetical protein
MAMSPTSASSSIARTAIIGLLQDFGEGNIDLRHHTHSTCLRRANP